MKRKTDRQVLQDAIGDMISARHYGIGLERSDKARAADAVTILTHPNEATSGGIRWARRYVENALDYVEDRPTIERVQEILNRKEIKDVQNELG